MSLFDDWNSSVSDKDDGKLLNNGGHGHSLRRMVEDNAVATSSNPFENASAFISSEHGVDDDLNVGRTEGEGLEAAQQLVEETQNVEKSPIYSENHSSFIANCDEAKNGSPSFNFQPVHEFSNGLSDDFTVSSVSIGGDIMLLNLLSSAGVSKLCLWKFRVSGAKKVSVTLQTLRANNGVRFASLCPQGNHGFVSLENGDNYYLHVDNLSGDPSTLRGRGPIKRLSDVVIESIAWDRYNDSPVKTGDVLIGTTAGTLWKVSIETYRIKDKKIIKKIHQLGIPAAITGIDVVRLGLENGKGNQKLESLYFVVLSTTEPTRLYKFAGGPNIEAVFEKYSKAENLSFSELPGTMARSEVHFHLPQRQSLPISFALLSRAGLYVVEFFPDDIKVENTHDSLTFPGNDMLYDSSIKVETNNKIVSLPKALESVVGELPECPITTFETDFLYLFLYQHWLVAKGKLDEKTVFEISLESSEYGSMLQFCLDTVNNTLYAVSEKGISRINMVNEDEDVWRLYLKQAHETCRLEMFDAALDSCRTSQQRDQVLTARAEFHLSRKEFDSAVECFVETSCAFEKVTLLLVNEAPKTALRNYLLLKLQRLPESYKTQRTIVCVWIVELYLEGFADTYPGEVVSSFESTPQAEELQFHRFMSEHSQSLKPAKDAIYNLISSYGRNSDYLEFAAVCGDYERIIVRHIQKGAYDQAVKTLMNQNRVYRNQSGFVDGAADPPSSFSDLYYKYSPDLILHCPKLMIDAWIEADSVLDPCKLIPSMIRYVRQQSHEPTKSANGENQIIRYLEHCVNLQNNNDEAIHNFLVSMYASRGQENDSVLREFLQSPIACFDMTYALRTCTENDQVRACVDIYSAMRLYSKAVQLALSIDPELARINASLPKDHSTRRKLWLQIAEHEISAYSKSLPSSELSSKGIVDLTLSIVKDSEVLMVEDILQFLPDFCSIEHLKDEIMHSLEQYRQDIDHLKGEMAEIAKTAEEIREEIEAEDSSFLVVDSSYKCDLCGDFVMNKAFYAFPCTHAFHSMCLLNESARHIGENGKEKVEKFRTYLEAQDSSDLETNELFDAGIYGDDGREPQDVLQSNDTKHAEYRSALDDFIAAACPFCGELMIQSVSQMFVSKEEEADAASWKI